MVAEAALQHLPVLRWPLPGMCPLCPILQPPAGTCCLLPPCSHCQVCVPSVPSCSHCQGPELPGRALSPPIKLLT